MLDLEPIKERLESAIYRNANPDLAALVAEVERLREALAYEIETVGKCGEEINQLEKALRESENLRSEAARLYQQERERAKQDRYEAAEERMKLTGDYWRLASAIRKHRDGWHRSENRMLVDRVVMRAAQARELWAVLDA